MQNTESYLQVMIESLIKKSQILDRIISKNEAQLECIKGKEYEEVNWTNFNVLVAEKETAINQINEIDEGFSNVYERVREDVLANKELYRDKVLKLQELISMLTDKGVKIQASEDRNRQIIDGIFQKTRQDIKKQRTSVKVASQYYKTMSNVDLRAADQVILDEKK